MPASVLAESLPRVRAAPRTLSHVTVHRDIDSVRAAWEHLVSVAPASPYQTPGWLGPWLTTVGQGLEQLFVLGSDACGPVALLCLGRSRRGGIALAQFLGGRDSNFGLGLFHPAVAWDEQTLRQLLADAARLGGLDLFWLANQPQSFAGQANPLASLPGLPSPSLQHETVLGGAPDGVLSRVLSARTRKHIRQKEAKLAALGPVRHEIADDLASAERIAVTLLAQRAARFGPTGREAELRAFLVAAALPPPGLRPSMELHALSCDGTIVAAFAGTVHAGRFSGMLVSIAPDPEWTRFSPGELLIARVMAAACRDGLASFDLGIGEARYKDSFCPTAVPLFDTVLGTTPRGQLAARGITAALTVKRAIKQSPRLRALMERGRSRWRVLSGRLAVRRP